MRLQLTVLPAVNGVTTAVSPLLPLCITWPAAQRHLSVSVRSSRSDLPLSRFLEVLFVFDFIYFFQAPAIGTTSRQLAASQAIPMDLKDEFSTSCQKQYSPTSNTHMASILVPAAPALSPGLCGRSCIPHHRPSWEITPGSVQNQSGTAMKGQYVANKRTHANTQSKCRAGRQSPAVPCLHHTLCQGVTGRRQHIDDGWLADNESSRLREASSAISTCCSQVHPFTGTPCLPAPQLAALMPLDKCWRERSLLKNTLGRCPAHMQVHKETGFFVATIHAFLITEKQQKNCKTSV